MRATHGPSSLVTIALLASDSLCQSSNISSTPSTSVAQRITEFANLSTCEARTINYITHTLPSLCLTSTVSEVVAEPTRASPQEIPEETLAVAESSNEQLPDQESVYNDAAGAPFMSFEDWKELMLQRTGQDPQEIRARRLKGTQARDRKPPDERETVWGGEDEIALDFSGQVSPESGASHIKETQTRDGDLESDLVMPNDETRHLHRSKDAGKTCKERFSYSSFDAGATILKTGPGTKNAKAILIENKDSYMLLQCGSTNKFVIIELSDDILLDTIVIANFEFFSSMIRHFRISVSDRYPVKADKWTDLGTFEARNSRDIQAFLVENPQIWAKYVRLEFLTHYGNEYYCPVSLIRMHGSRMLDSWKDTDGIREDDDHDHVQQDLVLPNDVDGFLEHSDLADREWNSSGVVSDSEVSLFSYQTNLFGRFCPVNESLAPFVDSVSMLLYTTTAGDMRDVKIEASSGVNIPDPSMQTVSVAKQHSSPIASVTMPQLKTSDSEQSKTSTTNTGSDRIPTPTGNAYDRDATASSDSRGAKSTSSSYVGERTHSAAAHRSAGNASSSPKAMTNQPSPPGRQRSTGTASPSAAPTIQQGFFNAVTKRLTQLETNLTLSMKYMEEQSKYVQEAMARVEQKQAHRIASSLDLMNHTIVTDLRKMHEQYDQLWQSTVFALESQKEQYERDVVALSARLNLLADEVVFQKRMAIAQAMLLLSCLFLVTFSRGVAIPYLAHAQPATSTPPTHASINAQDIPSHIEHGLDDRHAVELWPPRTTRLMTPDSCDDMEARDSLSSNELADEHADLTDLVLKRGASNRTSQPAQITQILSDDSESTSLMRDLHSAQVPRLSTSSQQQSRKPLPALPEDPSSP